MTKTSWSRFSKLALACLFVLSVATVPAAAVSVGDSTVTSDAEVGTEVTATATLTELYQNPSLEEWTLAGSTELTDVTWTVVYYDQTGAKVGQESYDGQSFSGAGVVADDGTSEVEIRVTGTVPQVDDYAYEPPQSFTVMALEQTREGGSTNEIDTWTATHYTQESRDARNAIDDAASTVEEVSDDEAERRLGNAIEAYDGEEFGLATDLAGQAEERAQQTQQSNQRMQLILYAVGGLVVVGLLVGGFLYWRSQQSGHDKLG
ncbi:hypothetical protein [Halobellus limi]|uniref:Uncharacterized protein n=1 Tax=Halobellus limi TaxID=699433 RepID=A0A1H5V5P5_9EURY|nr:hypothetical protein [Halobellus limi]QCC46811.1 hypothetical protein DV707_03525 [Halobellus limi]SEF82639.1 hypothetical protein SAMN04488133_0853 [Halobellus limi]